MPDSHSIDSLLSHLSDGEKCETLLRHLIKLTRQNSLQHAREWYDHLCEIQGHDELKAQAAWQMVAGYAAKGEIDSAIQLYETMKYEKGNNVAHLMREKALFALVAKLVPEQVSMAVKIWNKFSGNDIPDCTHWHWCRAGIYLMAYFLENSDITAARTICEKMSKVAEAQDCQPLKEKAKSMLINHQRYYL